MLSLIRLQLLLQSWASLSVLYPPSCVRTGVNPGLRTSSPTMDMIAEGLYLSDLAAAQELMAIGSSTGVTRVLSLGAAVEGAQEWLEAYKDVAVLDTQEQDMLSHLPGIVAFLEMGGSSLVHCVHGQSRSAMAIVAYLMTRRAYDLTEAYSVVAKKRPDICINPGFLRQLCLLDHLLDRTQRQRALGEYRLYVLGLLMRSTQSPDTDQLAAQLDDACRAMESCVVASPPSSRPHLDGHASDRGGGSWACRRCRTRVLRAEDVVRHTPAELSPVADRLLSMLQQETPAACTFYDYTRELPVAPLPHLRRPVPCAGGAKKSHGTVRECPCLYAQPVPWLLACIRQLGADKAEQYDDVKIMCPGKRCKAVLGTYQGLDELGGGSMSACACPCGASSIPVVRFRLERSALDHIGAPQAVTGQLQVSR